MTDVSNTNAPIGVFDSGLGGLTVVKAIQQALPYEHIVYFGDTARVPYGTKSRESVIRFSQQNARILHDHHIKIMIVACNTSSSYALPTLKRESRIPVLGVIEPGAKKAATLTRTGRIGVIGTQATVTSDRYARYLCKLDRSFHVISQACPLFVPLAEEGWYDKAVTASVAKTYLAPLKKARVDTVVLGCTHYPLLKKVIQREMGPNVKLVDSAEVMAEEVQRLLVKQAATRINKRKPKYQYIVSDQPEHFRCLAKQFLGHDIGRVKRMKF